MRNRKILFVLFLLGISMNMYAKKCKDFEHNVYKFMRDSVFSNYKISLDINECLKDSACELIYLNTPVSINFNSVLGNSIWKKYGIVTDSIFNVYNKQETSILSSSYKISHSKYKIVSEKLQDVSNRIVYFTIYKKSLISDNYYVYVQISSNKSFFVGQILFLLSETGDILKYKFVEGIR